ncbi:hypothetical protein LTR54_000460 [Friedmanniomyces endolithicus]|nr:hypothetical protein LTS00_012417 [Friedmanniomyces endolithicus]KAK1019817.1 hypothetical protein LTR54_000460 [Friedmanniomyces endolithicus]
MLTTQHTALLHRIRHTEEPSIAFKVGGLDALAAMDKVQAHDHGSGSGSDSGCSDLSALENETDEFGQRLLRHQRDVQRLNSAIRPGQQAFKRARPRARLAERVEQEEQRDGVGCGRVQERAGSGGSVDSEPPLNLPKQWGTKGKRRSDWLRKLHAPSEVEVPMANGEAEAEREVERADGRLELEDAIIPHRTAYTGDDNEWVAVGDDLVDALENTPPSMRRHTPTSMRHLNLTLHDDPDDNQDFSSASLVASTPAAASVNRHNRRIDELTRRELASIEKRGVAKRSLEHILEQSTTITTSPPRPVSAPSADATGAAAASKRRRSLIATGNNNNNNNNKENFPPHADVNGYGAYKGAETIGLVNRTAEAAVTFKNSSRPVHKRTDSYHLLKRLARVSSLSPSPDRDVEEDGSGGERVLPRDGGGRLDGRHGVIGGGGLEKERPHTSACELSSPLESPATGDEDDPVDMLPEVRIETEDVDATPIPRNNAQHGAKTPIVTGAWLDTPSPGIDVRPLLKSTDSTIVRAFGSPSAIAELEPRSDPMDSDPRRVFSEPAHAKSALADVLKEVRELERREEADGEEIQIGETTIQSLEDIVSPDLGHAMQGRDTTATLTLDITTETVIERKVDADGSLDEAPTTQAERDRRQEKLAMEAMNKHLRAARTSIKDANRGLRRVENRIDAAAIDPPAITPGSTSPSDDLPAALSINVNKTYKARTSTTGRPTPCPTCGNCATAPPRSLFRTLLNSFVTSFYTPPSPPSQPHGRPTYLALTLTSLLLYSALETLLCARYCNQRYATSMQGYGVDPDAPKWPFVIPTLVFGRFGRCVVGETVWEAVGAVVGNYFGAEDVAASAELLALVGPESILMGGRGRGSGLGREAFASARESVAGAGSGRGGHVYGSIGGWAKTTTAAVVSATARVVRSTVDAVDEVGSMWDDEFVV